MVVDLDRVARRLHPLLVGGGELARDAGLDVLGITPLALEEGGDEAGLLLGQRPDAALGLDQADEEQVAVLGVKDF